MELEIGRTGQSAARVTEDKTAAVCGSGSLPVFGTPYLLALMEEATCSAVSSALEDGQSTVGVSMDIQHTAPTPVGMAVRAEARLTEIKGKMLTFSSPPMMRPVRSAAAPFAAASSAANRF